MVRVLLEGVEVEASIGVSEAERSAVRPLRVDAALEVRGSATQSDDVRDTVDYAELADEIVACVRASSFKTLERLARELADRVLVRFELCESVTVRVAKPNPPMRPIVNSAGVELTLTRESS